MRLVTFTLLFLTLFTAVAQEMGEDVFENSQVYVIRDIEINIDGSTREDILVYNLEIFQGETFPGRSEFLLWLNGKRQIFQNFRTFSKTKIEYALEEGDESIYVDLVLTAVDSWAIIVLPKPKYDSNVGLQVSLSGRDYNFLGSMEPLRVNLDYDVNSALEQTWGFGVEMVQPFLINDEYFQFGLNNYFTIHPNWDPENDLQFYIEYQKQWNDLKFLIRGTQDYQYRPKDSSNILEAENLLENEFSIRSIYSFPFFLPEYGKPTYNPKIYLRREYPVGKDFRTTPTGVALGFDHSLAFGRINWSGNLREGFESSISNLFEYDLEQETWNRNVGFLLKHSAQFDWLGINSRLGGTYYIDGDNEDIAEKLRGILDSRIIGDRFVYLNTSLQIPFWDFRPTLWFNSDDWALLDWEFHIAPFIDFAISQNEEGDVQDWLGVGIEGYAFSYFAKSIFIRGSIGLDAKALIETGELFAESPLDGAKTFEVFIGLGFFF